MNALSTPDHDAARDRTHVGPPGARAFFNLSFRERIAIVWWALAWHTLFRWSPPFLNFGRLLLLRLFGAKVGRGVYVAGSVRIDFPWNLRLGNGVFVEHKCVLNCLGGITIGDRTRLSQYAHVCAATHDHTRPDMRIDRTPIIIGRDVWIAADAFVGPGVTIGDGSLLAARSSAFRGLPPGMVCIGEPARPVKPREINI